MHKFNALLGNSVWLFYPWTDSDTAWIDIPENIQYQNIYWYSTFE